MLVHACIDWADETYVTHQGKQIAINLTLWQIWQHNKTQMQQRFAIFTGDTPGPINMLL